MSITEKPQTVKRLGFKIMPNYCWQLGFLKTDCGNLGKGIANSPPDHLFDFHLYDLFLLLVDFLTR